MTKRILIAENDSMWRDIYKNGLKDAFTDIEVDELATNSGKDLVERVLTGEYAVVITDNRKEDAISGMEAIRRIRKAGNNVPLYLITGDNHLDEVARTTGATGFFAKGYFNGSQFVEKMKPYLS
ncbi:MAG: response regulator [Nanoarchaeota archaeon]